jgi:hypothetical protein
MYTGYASTVYQVRSQSMLATGFKQFKTAWLAGSCSL